MPYLFIYWGGGGGTNGFKKTHRLLEGHMIFHAGQSTPNRKAEKIVAEIEGYRLHYFHAVCSICVFPAEPNSKRLISEWNIQIRERNATDPKQD